MEISPGVLLLFAGVFVAFGIIKSSEAAAEYKFNAMMKSSVKLCSDDRPTMTVTGVSLIRCSMTCTSLTNCSHFNYRNIGKTCNLFQFTPKCYSTTPNCIHYQTENVQPAIVLTGIPAQNCSFPFTYGGALYYSCVQNVSNSCQCKCLDAGRVWRTVTDFMDYVAAYLTINVTIPTFSLPTSLMSINNWIVIQQRIDGSVNFNRNWTEYKAGFGNIATNFWLGLEKMYRLTASRTKKLRIEIQSSDNSKWFSAEYDTFWIDSEAKGYAIHVTGYSGDAGDGLNVMDTSGVLQNGMKFTTFDKDNDKLLFDNCATSSGGGGFWQNSCCYFDLNQAYGSTYFYWHLLTDLNLASTWQLKASRMMIRDV